MDKEELAKFWIDVGMSISFLLVGITGIFKIHGLISNFFPWALDFINFKLMSLIHDWSGVVMVILVFIHLALNRVWIKSMFSCIFGRTEQAKCDIKNDKRKK